MDFKTPISTSMEVTFTPSVVLTYSARRRSGLSFEGLIFTKLYLDFYLSTAYISCSEIRSGTMVIHPRWFHGASRRSACGGGAAKKRPAERSET
jgi:hypothetical protein